MRRLLRSNPDVVAVAVAIALLAPLSGEATPRLSLIWAGRAAGSGLEVRAERLWQRLEERMQRFEDRFERAAERRRGSEVVDYAAGE